LFGALIRSLPMHCSAQRKGFKLHKPT
jgi:hypothetical protein